MVTFDGATCKQRAAALALTLFWAVGIAGCTTVETRSFTVPEERRVEAAYVATNADFGKYRRLLADEMGIFFPRDAYTPPEDVRRIRQIFRTAFLDELQGYTIVDQSGPDVMRVQASLIDLRNSSDSTLMSLAADVRDIASRGELVFLMEMRDSRSNTVLARAADSAQTPTIATAEGVTTDWNSVEQAAQHWAALFRQFLDQNLGQ